MYQQWKALYEADHPEVQINITSHEAQAIQDVMTSALARGRKISTSPFTGAALPSTVGRETDCCSI